MLSCDNCEHDYVCCKNYGVTLNAKEVKFYEEKEIVPLTENSMLLGYVWVLKKVNGSCVFLKENKCTIYDRRPNACKNFDCRERI